MTNNGVENERKFPLFPPAIGLRNNWLSFTKSPLSLSPSTMSNSPSPTSSSNLSALLTPKSLLIGSRPASLALSSTEMRCWGWLTARAAWVSQSGDSNWRYFTHFVINWQLKKLIKTQVFNGLFVKLWQDQEDAPLDESGSEELSNSFLVTGFGNHFPS